MRGSFFSVAGANCRSFGHLFEFRQSEGLEGRAIARRRQTCSQGKFEVSPLGRRAGLNFEFFARCDCEVFLKKMGSCDKEFVGSRVFYLIYNWVWLF